MAICAHLNSLVVLLVIFLAGLWFLLVVALAPSHILYQSPLPLPRAPLVLPLHASPPISDSLQLVQLMGDVPSTLAHEQALLIVSCEWSGKDYLHLLEQLLPRQQQKKEGAPIYQLRLTSDKHLYSHRTLRSYTRNMLQMIGHCVESQGVEKLTVLAYQEAAMLSLLAISEASPALIQRFHKIILINPFGTTHQLYQNDPHNIAKAIKRNILSDSTRLLLFHQLRLIIINTFRTVSPQQPYLRHYFNFAIEDSFGRQYQLNNTITINSKHMWQVRTFLPRQLYFQHSSFVNQLVALLTDDQKNTLTPRAIDHLLRFGERVREGHGGWEWEDCERAPLEVLFRNSDKAEITATCTRLTIRQKYQFQTAALLISSEGKFQLHDQNDRFLPTHDSTHQTVYLLTNLKHFNQVWVINPLRSDIDIRLLSIRTPTANPLSPISHEFDKQNILHVGTEPVLIADCEGGVSGWLPPYIPSAASSSFLGSGMNVMSWQGGGCYAEVAEHQLYPEWFRLNWQAVRNTIIFTLFATHVLGKLTLHRFYTQLAVNLVLLSLLLGKFYPFENLIITAASTAIELIATGISRFSTWFDIAGRYHWVLLAGPLGWEVIGRSWGGIEVSWLGVLWAQIILAGAKQGFLITLVKCYFMGDIQRTQQSALYSLVLLMLWQLTNSHRWPFKSPSSLATAKRRLADILFLLMLGVSLGQQGGVIHQLVNFYMITHLLLAAGELANSHFEQT